MPVIFAGVQGERRRHHDDFRTTVHERPVELGKPEVVTDAQAHLEAVDIDHHGGKPPSGCLRFSKPGPIREVDIEQMDLSIARDEFAARRYDRTRVEGSIRIRRNLRKTAADDADTELAGPIG